MSWFAQFFTEQSFLAGRDKPVLFEARINVPVFVFLCVQHRTEQLWLLFSKLLLLFKQ